jgi:micrococcal nuclease
MTRKKGFDVEVLVVLILVSCIVIYCFFVVPPSTRVAQDTLNIQQEYQYSSTEAPIKEGTYAVLRVIDGDTIVLDGYFPVRLIGINAPELNEPLGRTATEFVRQTIGNSPVRIVFDGNRTDRYGRVRAHVYIGDIWLNEAIVREGLAISQPQYQMSHNTRLLLVYAEIAARKDKKNLWRE